MSDLVELHENDPGTSVRELRSQHPVDLLGVPRAGLMLRWRSSSSTAAAQLGFQLAWQNGRATTGPTGTESGWTIEPPVRSSDSVDVPAPGGDLPDARERSFSVRIATKFGWSAWSDPLVVDAALDGFSPTVITAPSDVDGPSPYLRRTLDVREAPVRALLRVSSLGLHELEINGVRVGDEFLSPGWTSYQQRVVVATHDVTPLLRAGDNVLGAVLADGWFRGRLGWRNQRHHYGEHLGLALRLEVEYPDGSTDVVESDEHWRWSTGSIRMSGIYDGCDLDLSLDQPGWSIPGFDDSEWMPVSTLPIDPSIFVPRIAQPVRAVAEFPGTLVPRSDRTRIDLEQNIAGWLRLTVRGRAGDRVVVRHAEVLEPDGSLHTAALRSARAADTYVLDRDGEHVLEPRFTFHGFQFADVVGADVVSAVGIAISSDTPVRGSFSSDHPQLDRLHENVVWSQRDNFVSVPTDCPQRDERLGWTGDAQAFAATASTLFDSEAFWRSWLIDLEIDQDDDGAVAAVVPNIIHDTDFDSSGSSGIMGRAGWADAATIVPWSVYVSTGSDLVLRQQLESARRWVAHLERRVGDDGMLPSEFQFGDWLDPDAPGDKPWQAKVSGDAVANAFFSYSARLLARIERLVGDSGRAEAAERLAIEVAERTWSRWGEHLQQSQSGCAMAIELGIAPAALHDELGDRLAELVRAERGRIATGFLGTPLVLPALTRTGHLDEAYLMLTRRESPSWLYEVDRGATTIWERWDALREDGSIHPGDMDTGDTMLSFNHYAYGAVIDWVYRTVAGIAPVDARPGYELVHVAPRPALTVRAASASIETAFGRLSIDWRLDDSGALTIELEVPFGAEAELDLAVDAGSSIRIGGTEVQNGETLPAGRHEIIASAPTLADPARALDTATAVA